jgi:hypothetical protein
MRTRFLSISMCVLACAGLLCAKENARSGKPGQAAGAAGDDVRAECLGCHGPFDKIAAASSKYVAPSGEKTTPHRYVPHKSRQEEDVPECSLCHTAHPVDPPPAKGSIDLSAVGVQWCYDACHHEKNLTSCKKCHP